MIKQNKTAIFANGCFWCTEAIFNRVEGVLQVVSGFTGGTIKNPAYREICNGSSGHAECLSITYRPEVVSFNTLLEVFFATHDPTTLNRQGNDVGTQYRSEIFFSSEVQKNKSEAFIALLTNNKVFPNSIVTKVTAFDVFYKAEENHHNYYNENKEQAYCQFIISPKIEKIKEFYAEKLKT